MKKLTTEQKAKAYDEAIKRGLDYIKHTPATEMVTRQDIFEAIFPELKESEDEKIRKALIKYYSFNKDGGTHALDNITPKQIVAWLEKQGNLMKALQISNARIGELIEENYYLREQLEKQGENTYNKVLSELLHKVICTFINDPDIPYFDREKVSMEVLPYVERLEKQGEQKPAIIIPKFRVGDEIKTTNEAPLTITKITDSGYWSEDLFICSFENSAKWELVGKLIDKIEPKFKVGDWVIFDNGNVERITSVGTHGYTFDDGDYLLHDDCDKNAHLWTINDAKDGDVLVNKYGAIFINAGSSNRGGTLDCYCYLSVKNKFCIEKHKTGSWLYKDEIKPATKEQRDLLFQKMKEAGYEWDTEKKKLKKIEQKPVIEMKTPEESLGIDSDTYNKIVDECIYGEQKPAWSEEDEAMWAEISDLLWEGYKQSDSKFSWDDIRNWVIPKLKSLKDRVQPKQEWSEDDYNEIETIACHLDNTDNESMAEVLRNIRDKYYSQNKWKPSEEQMKALNAINVTGGISYAGQGQTLIELYNNLKKLKR